MPKALVFLILALPLVGAYAMYATGIVVIYQASRVVNLAHGAMAVVPAYVFTALMHAGVPLPLSLFLGLGSGALTGITIERVFVRRLRGSGATAQTVGTVAAFGLLISITAKIAGTGSLTAAQVFPDGEIHVGASILRTGQIGLLAVAVVATALLTVLFRRTWIGLAMRGAATNRRAASLMGVDPNRTSAVAWAIGGVLAAGAGILLAAVTALNPYTLSASVLPAYVAALIGGLESLPAALAGSAIVGLVIGFVPVLAGLPILRNVLGQVGGPELTLAVTAMIVMAVRGKGVASEDASARVPTAHAQQRAQSRVRAKTALPKLSPRVLLVAAVLWVFIPGVPGSIVGNANTALVTTIAAASLVLLTGWLGQISLAQAAFVGIGAFTSVKASSALGIPFPFTIPVAAIVAGASAAALGAVALRVRGLYLAVATLIFAWMSDQYLFSSPWFVGAGGSAEARVKPIGVKGGFPYFDFSDKRTVYLVALAGAGLVLAALANVKRSKTGRAFFAIRGSETAAASLGVHVARYKLIGFALAGCIAGIAGALTAVSHQTVLPSDFAFTVSLFYVSVAVVGGLQSLGGAVASSIVFAGLEEIFYRVNVHGTIDIVSAGLLAVVLLAYPGGLSRIPDALAPRLERLVAAVRFGRPQRDHSEDDPGGKSPSAAAQLARRFGRELRGLRRELSASGGALLTGAERRASPALKPGVRALRAQVRGVAAEGRDIGGALRRLGPKTLERAAGQIDPEPQKPGPYPQPGSEPGPQPGTVMLEARDVTVAFGGLVAVNAASLRVCAGQIVGLIGPNGAGKTTLFNAIAGFVTPQKGSVHLRQRDVTSDPVHTRAALGLGRTFQTIQVSSELTVLENLLVATHAANDSSFLSNLVVGRRSVEAEAEALDRAFRAAALTGIEDVLDRPCGGLPFGTLRMVELARALVTEAPVLLLDEPASGLDSVETAALASLLRELRDDHGLSLLVIEHDVRFVMSLCDYVYVLDQGVLIAEGTPSEVGRDPQVVAAYLGAVPHEPNVLAMV